MNNVWKIVIAVVLAAMIGFSLGYYGCQQPEPISDQAGPSN